MSRGNGEGTIYRRKDGRYAGAVSLDTGRRKTVYGRTRADVQARLVLLQRELQQGLPVPDERKTLDRFLQEWLENTVKPTARRSTYLGYESLVRVHIAPRLGKVRLARLTPQQIETFQNERLQAGCAPRTVQYMRAVLRAALNKAVDWNLIGRNPVNLVKAPSVRRPEVRPLTAAQVQTFLAGVRGDRLEALYATAFTMGLRQGELLALRWEDIDFEANTLRVSRTLTRSKAADQFGEPKSDRSRRTLYLPPLTATALRAHRLAQLEQRLAAGADWQDMGLVFTAGLGTPLDGCNVRKYFQRHLKRLNLPPQRFHDARHSCASLLLAIGIAPRVVMETLGHSQISLTMNTYSHVVPELQREAANEMDRLLSAAH